MRDNCIVIASFVQLRAPSRRKRDAREKRNRAPESSRVTVDPIFFPLRSAPLRRGATRREYTRRVPELKLIPAMAAAAGEGTGKTRRAMDLKWRSSWPEKEEKMRLRERGSRAAGPIIHRVSRARA